MLDHLCSVFLGRTRIGMDCSGGIDIPLSIRPHTAEQALTRHDRVQFNRFFDAHQTAIFDPDGLEGAIGGLQPFPAIRRARHRQTTCHVKPDVLTAFLFNLAQQINRIGLQLRDIRVRVQRMYTARCMPR